MTDWENFKCAVNDLKDIVNGNTSFEDFDIDDLKNLLSKVHDILHILKNEVKE